MTAQIELTPLHVPAREIPVPQSVSPEARASFAAPMPPAVPYPDVNDTGGWRNYIRKHDEELLAFFGTMPLPGDVDVKEIMVDNVRIFEITPHDLRAGEDCVYLDIHGGALIMGGGELCRTLGMIAAARRGVRVWSVDYRMPPDHPYPAALDDCLSAYRALLLSYRPDKIIVAGGSAGGNLAAAMILKARDEGLPLPAGAVLITPEVDLTESGDSFHTNLGLDSVLAQPLMPANLLYAGGADLKDPYLSPLFGDFSQGFPRTLLSSGTRDLFLSNAVRMHWALRAHDVPAELFIVEAASHPGFPGAPESEALDREIDLFCRQAWGIPTA